MYVNGVRDQLKGFVKALEPGVYDPLGAKRLVGELAEIERLAATGKALMAARVADTDRSRKARSTAKWLAEQSGSSVGEAAAAMQTAEQISKLPHTEEALRDGRISPAQARQIAEGSVTDPSAEDELLALAQSGSMVELRDAARRKRAEGEDETARYARIRRSRYFNHRVEPDGAVSGSFRFTPDDGAELLAAMGPFRDAAFQHARVNGQHESMAAYAADGLVGLARWFRITQQTAETRASRPAGPAGPVPTDEATDEPEQRAEPSDEQSAEATETRPVVPMAGELVPLGTLRPSRDAKIIVRIDATALQRGHAEAGEVCEIAGIGPVPVAVVYSLLPQALATAVITKGEAVATAAHAGRHVTATQLTALQWAGIGCEVDGCDMREHLEIDHLIDYSITHHTTLAELGYKCRLHHDLKTYRGWDFIPGTKQLVPPDHRLHPKAKGRDGPPSESPSDQNDRDDDDPQLPLSA
jgi:hypothetical protein